MTHRPALDFLPRPTWLLVGIYTFASIVHFAHNAEFIAMYPNMPAWITREHVYVAWLAVAAPGAAGLVALWCGRRAVGALLLAVYGALGIDGLAHYTLALCSQHPWVSNATIWFEVLTGSAVALLVGARLVRHGLDLSRQRHARIQA